MRRIDGRPYLQLRESRRMGGRVVKAHVYSIPSSLEQVDRLLANLRHVRSRIVADAGKP